MDWVAAFLWTGWQNSVEYAPCVPQPIIWRCSPSHSLVVFLISCLASFFDNFAIVGHFLHAFPLRL
jgi:hypothetical protein